MDDNLNTQESAKPPIQTPDGLSPLERDIGTNTEIPGGPNHAKPGVTPPGAPAEPPAGGPPPAAPEGVPPPADEVPADQPITPPPAEEGPPPSLGEAQRGPEPVTGGPGSLPASPPGGPTPPAGGPSPSEPTESRLSDRSVGEPAPEPSTPPPAGGTENNKPSDLPDTDEFLQNIMGEEQKSSTQPEVPPTPSSPPPTEPPPTNGSGLPQEPLTNPYEETPPEEEPPAPEGGTPPSEPDGAEKPAAAVNGVSPGQAGEQGVSSDIVGSMQKAPAKGSKNGLKLLGLIIVAVILVIGGYLGYRALFAPATPTATTKSTTASATVTATVAQSLDDTRKSDLQTIAAALKEYKTASGKYPAAETLVLLTDTSNPLTTALVPTYLTTMPSDPNVSKSYGYKSDGTTFVLSTVLDSTKDPDGVLEGGKYLYKVTEATVTSSASAAASPTVTVTSGSASSPAAETNLPI